MGRLARVPAEITVLAGAFGPFPAAQPLVFAHLWDIAPDLDLGAVEVIPASGATTRLAAIFDDEVIARLTAAAEPQEVFVLVLPAAYQGLAPPDLSSTMLRPLGPHRGHVRHLVQDPSGS